MSETDRQDAAFAPFDDAAAAPAYDQHVLAFAAARREPEAPAARAHAADNDDDRLLDDELEHGIASVFAALHAATGGDDDADAYGDQAYVDDAYDDDDDGDAPLSPFDAAEGKTFRLLGELDRLWHRAA